MIEDKVEIYASMNFPVKTIYDFIIKPENMKLFSGFLLIPGIKNVISSDNVRKVGTLDKIVNTDNSSHESVTDILEINQRYCLTLRNIEVSGLKKKLATPIIGFREEWIFQDNLDQSSRIARTLFIQHKTGVWNKFLVTFLIRPQIYFSLLIHHQNILKSLS